MAAMKPRTGDGPLEVTKEGRGIVMRVPLEGGGRLVVDHPGVDHLRAGGADALRDKLPVTCQTLAQLGELRPVGRQTNAEQADLGAAAMSGGHGTTPWGASAARVSAKRARQINNYHHQLGEGMGLEDAPPPLVESRSKNYLTMAMEEIARGKLTFSYGAPQAQ
jgi:DNA-directed RNA polymerase subunit omega